MQLHTRNSTDTVYVDTHRITRAANDSHASEPRQRPAREPAGVWFWRAYAALIVAVLCGTVAALWLA